jgi:hypothetical protein
MAYVSVKPLAEKSQYLPNDTIDFLLDVGMGNEFVGNSFRIEGEVLITQAGDPVENINVFYDSKAGAHSFFQQVVTQLNDRTVENINYYGRYASMKSQSLDAPINKMAVSSNATELKMLNDDMTIAIASTADLTTGRSFSIKPFFCLNSMSGNLSYATSGQVKVSVTLASISQCLFGGDVTLADTAYYLQNLSMSCRVVPQSQASKGTVAGVVACVRQNIQSNNTTLSIIVPIATSSFSATFRNAILESSPQANYLELDTLPETERVEMTFSDSLSNLIQFPMETTQEIALNYLASMGTQGKHSITLEQEVVGLGLAYNEILSNTKLGVNIICGASNTDAYVAYLYFKGVIGL